MAARSFEFVQISEGSYVLVPEDELPGLVAASEVTQLLGIDLTEAKTLGYLVKFFRFKRELSKSQLAEATNLNRHTISKLESDPGHKPDFDTLKSLADYFGSEFSNALTQLGFVRPGQL